MALDLQRFINRFLGEGRDQLTRLAAGLGRLEQAPEDTELLDGLFRAAHTLKGSARMLKLNGISDTAHHLEDLLGGLRDRSRRPDAELVSLLLAGVDGIGRQLDAVAAGATNPAADPGLIAALTAATGGAAPDPAPAPPPPSTTTATAPAPTPGGPGAADSVRVPLARLDDLVALIGEVISQQQRLQQRIGGARALARRLQELTVGEPGLRTAALAGRDLARDLRDDIQAQDQLTRALGECALALRMLPLAMLFEPGARMVRELARELGKEVRCEVEGSEIELDRQIIEHLGDALVHLLRNAVDHGIEDPADRLAAGKPAAGRLRISARPIGAGVEVEVSDDGRGLDRERILAKAIQRGLIDPTTAAGLSDEQVWELVFLPGLSTSAIVTQLSGRGVGMDAIRRTVIDDLRGTISLHSHAGQGSRVRLRLPLTLAVMPVLLCQAGDQAFALAAQHVVELIRVQPAETIMLAGRPALVLRNEFVPLLPLAELLRLPAAARPPTLTVIVAVRQAKLGLLVEAILDARDMVIKPLPDHLRGCGLVAGIATTGDNTLISLLQTPVLMEAARRSRAGTAGGTAGSTEEAVSAGREPWRLLVVDDSQNTREIVKDVLEACGYLVSTAADGLEGWQRAVGGSFDAILTDVEMPGLDGFALTARLRADPRYRTTPILIISSREQEEDKRRGIAVGADAYIVKGDFDQSGLLETLANLLGDLG